MKVLREGKIIEVNCPVNENIRTENVRAKKIAEVKALANQKVAAIVDPEAVLQYMAEGAALNRKKVKFLSDPNNNQDLTQEEEAQASALESAQQASKAVRVAGQEMTAEIKTLTGQPLYDYDTTETNILWP